LDVVANDHFRPTQPNLFFGGELFSATKLRQNPGFIRTRFQVHSCPF
jgi:hypothetical protein